MKDYVIRLLGILPTYPKEIHRVHAIRRIREDLVKEKQELPATLDQAIQSAYNAHCEGYAAFEKGKVKTGRAPVFKSGDKRSGNWSVHPDFKPLELEDFL
ncbi:MAG: hypothetical protein OXH76_02070 [Boseongicola sp.]|nr:hypothetical protein [Boseongicola sp.]MYH56509.1 hypothetical protein [Boseongicola sp. SB0675_bin_26]